MAIEVRAARVASELGADVVKVNVPHPDKRENVPAAYAGEFTHAAGHRSVWQREDDA